MSYVPVNLWVPDTTEGPAVTAVNLKACDTCHGSGRMPAGNNSPTCGGTGVKPGGPPRALCACVIRMRNANA